MSNSGDVVRESCGQKLAVVFSHASFEDRIRLSATLSVLRVFFIAPSFMLAQIYTLFQSSVVIWNIALSSFGFHFRLDLAGAVS